MSITASRYSIIRWLSSVSLILGIFYGLFLSGGYQYLTSVFPQFQSVDLFFSFYELKGRDELTESLDIEEQTDLAIRIASSKYNVDYAYLKTLSLIESGNNPDAISFTGAKGLYQFTSLTASHYNLVTDLQIFNPYLNADAAARLTQDNIASLKRVNLKLTPTNIYLAHQQGIQGLIRIYKIIYREYPMTPIIRRRLDQNGGINLTAEEFIQFWEVKINQIYVQFSQSQSPET